MSWCGRGIEVGVGADALVHLPAKQRVDRTLARFAEDVPAGNLQSRKRTHDRQVRALREAGGIGATEHQLDVFRVLALHVPLEHVLDHGAHRIWPDGGGIAFTPAGYPRVCRDFDEDPVAPTPTRGRGGGDDDIEVLQLHLNMITLRLAEPDLVSSIASLI